MIPVIITRHGNLCSGAIENPKIKRLYSCTVFIIFSALISIPTRVVVRYLGYSKIQRSVFLMSFFLRASYCDVVGDDYRGGFTAILVLIVRDFPGL